METRDYKVDETFIARLYLELTQKELDKEEKQYLVQDDFNRNFILEDRRNIHKDFDDENNSDDSECNSDYEEYCEESDDEDQADLLNEDGYYDNGLRDTF